MTETTSIPDCRWSCGQLSRAPPSAWCWDMSIRSHKACPLIKGDDKDGENDWIADGIIAIALLWPATSRCMGLPTGVDPAAGAIDVRQAWSLHCKVWGGGKTVRPWALTWPDVGRTFLGTVWGDRQGQQYSHAACRPPRPRHCRRGRLGQGDSLKSEAIGMIAGALYGYFGSYFSGWEDADKAGKRRAARRGKRPSIKVVDDYNSAKVSQRTSILSSSGVSNTNGSQDWDAEGAYSKASARSAAADEVFHEAYAKHQEAFDKTYLGFYVKSSKKAASGQPSEKRSSQRGPQDRRICRKFMTTLITRGFLGAECGPPQWIG